MSNSTLVQIADILPPAAPVAPASASVAFWVYVLLLILCIVLATIWYLRSSKQKLRRLRRQYQQRKLDSRQCAFRLSRLLCQRLQIARISTSLLPEQHDRTAWQTYATCLQAAYFSRHCINNNEITDLLDEAEQWL